MPITSIPMWANERCPVIGMLHVPALPGSPRYGGAIAPVRERVLADARVLIDGGVHGLMLENFGDTPFMPGRTPAHVVSHLTVIAQAVRDLSDLPIGVNVLRNDGRSALAIAHAIDAAFIRVNVLCGARVTDQGVIEGIAHDLLRDRMLLRAEHIEVFADVNVKHSSPLGGEAPAQQEVHDVIERGLAGAVIVSGSGTGAAVDLEALSRAKEAAGETPVLIGSGARPSNVAAMLPYIDGIIAGTTLKRDRELSAPVAPERVAALLNAIQTL